MLQTAALQLADVGFYVFHTLLVLFNMFGWIWRQTRFWHLICMSLTAFSWFVMGAIYGWGYCVCTDWHFQIRDALGYEDPGISTYVQLMSEQFFGISISRFTSDVWAVAIFVLILLAMAIVWFREWQHRKQGDFLCSGGASLDSPVAK